ncbi:MAG: N-formylglutamate amidohydrolase [Beijerinckiaceae bacterium]
MGPAGRTGGEAPLFPDFDPPVEIVEPAEHSTPLIVSSPHSGSIYPESFLARSRLDALALRRSEDAYVDELFAGAVDCGAPLLRARFPRAFLDVNREPYELDPRMFDGRLPSQANTRSIRVAGGLGTIARVVSESQEIYKGRLPVSEVELRIKGLYEPYHMALRSLIERAWQTHGSAVLLDCHSMPSLSQTGTAFRAGEPGRADIILGDRYGTSCEPKFVTALESMFIRRGFSVGRNKPYAGGFITENYGSPALGAHAIQIEVNRGLYMFETTLEKRPSFANLAKVMAEVVEEFAAFVQNAGSGMSAAAE